jgi:hypothetical protein
MSTVSSIVIPVAVAVVSGGFGSIITTYGTQAKDRRDARGIARENFTKAEDTVTLTGTLALDELASLESSAFTAEIPSYLVEAYKDARRLAEKERRDLKEAQDALLEDMNEQAKDRVQQAKTRSSSADLAASMVSALLLRSLWHPLLARPTRHHQCRQLCLVLADLDHVSADQKLGTRRERQLFVQEHVDHYRRLKRDERHKERESKRSLPSGQVKLDGSSPQVPVDEGARG